MTGERMMDRIPFEEWALKSIDPALAPRPLRQLLESDKGKAKAEDGRPIKLDPDEGLGNRYSHMVSSRFDLRTTASPARRSDVDNPDPADQDGVRQVPFVYPPSLEQPDELISTFRKSLAHREPYHRKWMKLNLYLSPLTLPFALVPVIPNLPFFYMLCVETALRRGFGSCLTLMPSLLQTAGEGGAIGEVRPLPSFNQRSMAR